MLSRRFQQGGVWRTSCKPSSSDILSVKSFSNNESLEFDRKYKVE